MIINGRTAAQAVWLGPKAGGHLAPFLYSSRDLSELSQWLCYDDSTIYIVVVIIIIIIRVATRPVFAGTSRFSACLSHVPVECLPGRYMSRFLSISTRPIAIALFSEENVLNLAK